VNSSKYSANKILILAPLTLTLPTREGTRPSLIPSLVAYDYTQIFQLKIRLKINKK
jgi:hypothetical protein